MRRAPKRLEIGHQLQVPVVALHNVEPLAVGLSAATAWSVVVARPDSERRALAAKLLSASRDLNVDSQPVVRHELNSVAAIVDEASARDADLIVVGARTRRRFGLAMFGSIASRVVNRAQCSVLVLPLREVIDRAGAPDVRALSPPK